MQIFAVKDTKALKFNTPFFHLNPQTATRAFSMDVNRPDEANVLYTNPEDFELYSIGEYDTDRGVIRATEPQFLVNAASLKREANK